MFVWRHDRGLMRTQRAAISVFSLLLRAFLCTFTIFCAFFYREVHLKLSADIIAVEKLYAPRGRPTPKKHQRTQRKLPFLDCLSPTKGTVPIPQTWTEGV